MDVWNKDLEVGLTGAFLCSQIVGNHMKENKNGVIINIASDLALIAPDQRIYRKKNMNTPVSYAATKGAFLNFTRYVAAYWQKRNDKTRTILTNFFGSSWANDYIDVILFDC